MGPQGFPRQTEEYSADSPAASRAGFRCATQLAANYGGTFITWILRPHFSKVKPRTKPVIPFARFHLNTGILLILALGLRNLGTVLMMHHVDGGKFLIKPYLTVDSSQHAQTDVHMFFMTIHRRLKPINHLAVSILNR